MTDYIKSLEEQNEKLKESLAKSQQEALDCTQALVALKPKWQAINGSLFEFGAYMSVIGEVYYDDNGGNWFYKFHKKSTDWDDRVDGPFNECYDAQQAMEKKYWSLMSLFKCVQEAMKK